MTVLVLGAGLIGGLTAQLLAQRGDKVVLADVRDGAAPDGIAVGAPPAARAAC